MLLVLSSLFVLSSLGLSPELFDLVSFRTLLRVMGVRRGPDLLVTMMVLRSLDLLRVTMLGDHEIHAVGAVVLIAMVAIEEVFARILERSFAKFTTNFSEELVLGRAVLPFHYMASAAKGILGLLFRIGRGLQEAIDGEVLAAANTIDLVVLFHDLTGLVHL